MNDLVLRNRQRVRPLDLRELRRIARALLGELLALTEYQLGVQLVAAPEMTVLNKTFLDHEGSTDVITFDHSDQSDAPTGISSPAPCSQDAVGMPQIPPHPALSPSDGERVAEGRVRGGTGVQSATSRLEKSLPGGEGTAFATQRNLHDIRLSPRGAGLPLSRRERAGVRGNPTTALSTGQARGLPTDLHGELFICVDDAVAQAREFGTTWQSEIVRYLVHGVLHLRGHDDHAPEARRKMKREENRLLRGLARRFDLSRLARAPKVRP